MNQDYLQVARWLTLFSAGNFQIPVKRCDIRYLHISKRFSAFSAACFDPTGPPATREASRDTRDAGGVRYSRSGHKHEFLSSDRSVFGTLAPVTIVDPS